MNKVLIKTDVDFVVAIQHIPAFLATVQCLNFSEASRKLGVHRGQVSKSVRELERITGCKFFNRTTRQVSLTPAGTQFHRNIAPLMDVLEKVVMNHEGRPATHIFVAPWSAEIAAVTSNRVLRKNAADLIERKVQDGINAATLRVVIKELMDKDFVNDSDLHECLSSLHPQWRKQSVLVKILDSVGVWASLDPDQSDESFIMFWNLDECQSYARSLVTRLRK